MKDGFVQQVDTPQNLYDYPPTCSLPAFIGSPQMNFFTVKLVKEGNDVAAVFGDNKIIIPPSKLAKFADEDYIGKEVYMGIPSREHPRRGCVHPGCAQCGGGLQRRSDRAHGLRDLPLPVHQRQGREHHRPRQSPHHSRAGQKVQIAFDVNHLHFFDKETETTLLTR